MDLADGLLLLGEVLLAGGPDGEDEGQARPLLPHLAEVVDLEAEAWGVVEAGAQGGVADEDGGVGLLHHRAEVGRAGVVVRGDAVPLGEQQFGEADRGAGGRAEGDPAAVELFQRELGDDHAGHDGPVAADRDVGEGDQAVGVLEELDQGDRADVEVAPDELLGELLGGVLGQLQVEQGPGAGESPVEGDAVEELDVADPGPAGPGGRVAVRSRAGVGREVVGCVSARIVHLVRLAPPRTPLAPGPAERCRARGATSTAGVPLSTPDLRQSNIRVK